MIKNYLKTAWRSLTGNKFYSLVNISGLACGLATAILLLLWVQHERSYDRFHRDYNRTYRILAHFDTNNGEMVWDWVPGPLSVLSQAIPTVESVVRLNDDEDQILSNADRSKVMDGFHTTFVDSSFFDIFDFKLLEGNPLQPFPDNSSVMLTQSTARKFFGEADAMGKVIQFRGHPFTVTGILQDFPDNSSLQFDALFPMGFYGQQFTENGGNGDWKTIDTDMGNYAFKTFVKLNADASSQAVAHDFYERYKAARHGDSQGSFQLQPLSDVHLVTADGNHAAARMVSIFFIVAILVMAVAAINYVNLSTARALVRAREVGIRKVIGAGKRQLFLQFMLETTVLFAFALLAALVLIFLLLPVYNGIAGKTLFLSFANTEIWKVIGYSAAGTLLAASIYPALLLSGLHPLKTMKGNTTSGMGTALFRKGLVVGQFAISMALIVATLVISRQMDYIRKMDLGYDKSYVMSIPLTGEVVDHIDAIKTDLAGKRGIVNAALSDIYDLSNLLNASSDIEWEGKPTDDQTIITQAVIDRDFIPTMKIQLLEGSNFTGMPTDSNAYIVNEAAVKAMELKPPYAGQPITVHGRKGTIIGVVKDFNFKSVRERVAPLLFFNWWKGNILYVRTTTQDAQHAIAAIEQQYKKYAGDAPFSFTFIDKQFEAKYDRDQRAGLLFNIFAGIAIFISCLGLLGLSTYTVRQRVKEIGIRKVLGASVGSIVQLLTTGSLLLVVTATVIAAPLAWWAMNKWLEDFSYRIDIQWWMFAVAGLVTVVIALLTVSWQAIRAAVANPVDSLKDE